MQRLVFRNKCIIPNGLRALNNGLKVGGMRYCEGFCTTYSGGQPTDGQGGYYGSLKSRSDQHTKLNKGYKAEVKDIEDLDTLIEKAKSMDKLALKTFIQKDENVHHLIQNLHVHGAPVWGLSTMQRNYVTEWKLMID